MRFDVADDRFRDRAAQWLASLDDATLPNLRAVFAVSPGYYPTTLHELWRAELFRRGLEASSPSWIVRTPVRFVPVGHPQDCDWRFTTETARALVSHAVADLVPDDRVAHLGTPSTFMAGMTDCPDHRHVLLDRNAAITTALTREKGSHGQVICIDLTVSEPPSLDAAAAIIDPPWYPRDTLAFLAAASYICREGALLWLCQPTLATRPGVDEERSLVQSELARLGLDLTASYACGVRYRMPHFEAMSLRLAAPELPVPPDWRTGDLLVLRKVRTLEAVWTSSFDKDPWREVRFGPVRIKLRATDARENLGSLVLGDVLDTVSRRDPIRQRVGLWTSGNRIYSLADPDKIGNLIELCDTDLANTSFSVARTHRHARRLGLPLHTAQKLFDMLLTELQEHTSLAGAEP